MAESLVQVTEGVGKKFHSFSLTIGANTVEDQIVRTGDAYVASYNVSCTVQSVATANSHVLELMAGSSLNVYLRRITIWQVGLATTAAIGQWELRRLTTAGTGGTAFTPVAQDTNDAAPGATAMGLPTVNGTEASPPYRWATYFMQTVGASAQLSQPIFDMSWPSGIGGKPLRIGAGTANGIAVKNVTAIAAATVLIDLHFTEQNY